MTADTPTPQQCRAARALVKWSIERLAHESGVSKNTISSFEQEKTELIRATRGALRIALERGGVGFLDAADGRGVGVYLQKP